MLFLLCLEGKTTAKGKFPRTLNQLCVLFAPCAINLVFETVLRLGSDSVW